MKRTNVKNERLVALFLLGCTLFSYPFLDIFNVRAFVFGIPALYLYLLVAWVGMIALAAIVVGRRESP
jgi:uncharacterized membrane protein